MGTVDLLNIIPALDGAALPRRAIRALGIDLGTTNSVVAEAVWSPAAPREAIVRCLEVEQETREEGTWTATLVPSVVALADGREFVGEGAKRLMGAGPRLGLKRNQHFFFETKNEIGTSRRYRAAPESYRSPAEIAGRILGFLLRAAGDLTPDRVVVTVPASFQAAQRRDTVAAAALAGIDIMSAQLFDEPIAAFVDDVARNAARFDMAPGARRTLMVFDFGGGTCDVAIFALERAKDGPLGVAPLSISRFHRLGGGDIDAAIVYEHLIPKLLDENGLRPHELDFHQKKNLAEPQLRAVAEALKTGLCREIVRRSALGAAAQSSPAVKVQPGVYEVDIGTAKLKVSAPSLGADDFNRIAAPFLERDILHAKSDEYRTARSVIAPIDDALQRAGLAPGDIDLCLLVGGSCGLPRLSSMLDAYFGRAQLLEHRDAEERKLTVARGAALQSLALALAGKPLVDPVCPDAIALRTAGAPVPLVARGAKLPFPAEDYAASDRLAAPASSDRTPTPLKVEIVAGAEQRILFSVPWEIPPPTRRGEPLALEYRLDANQVLELRLRKSGDPGAPPFTTRVENPLSNVVNPVLKEIEAEGLKEKLANTAGAERDWTARRLASLLGELGRREKAIAILRALMREKGRPDAGLLNAMGLLYHDMGAAEPAAKLYRETANAAPQLATPLFNLALLLRRDDPAAAAAALEQSLARTRSAPSLTHHPRCALGLYEHERRGAVAGARAARCSRRRSQAGDAPRAGARSILRSAGLRSHARRPARLI